MALGSNEKRKSIFKAPLLYVGLGLDSDTLRSPTSPLDVTLLTNRGTPLRTTSPNEGPQKGWDCFKKLGLSILDSLDDCSKFSRNVVLSSDFNKGSCPSSCPQMITKVPNCDQCFDSVFHKGESNVVFEIGETLNEHELPFGKSMSCSLDLYGRSKGSNFGSNTVSSSPCFIGGSSILNSLSPDELNVKPVSVSACDEFIKTLSASEIANSEDYTCVISHGPNPKKTHIFCDCILEIDDADGVKKCRIKNEEKEGLFSPAVDGLETPNQCPSAEFLTFCNHCNKKLEDGKDIYIYRGEKSFCSLTCRALEIMIDEELEKSNAPSENSLEWESGEELFGSGIITTA